MSKLLLGIVSLWLVGLQVATAEVSSQSDKKTSDNKIEQRKCPVLGGKIKPELYYQYKGQKIYVCCPRCIDKIKEDPEKYLKKVRKEKEEIAEARKITQKTCPVMSGVIVPNLYYQYNKKIYVCCPGCIDKIKKDPDKYLLKVQKQITESKDKKQATCPVMGGKINSDLYYEYNKKIYVCCPGCIPIIKKNPDKYIKKVLEEQKKHELKKEKVKK
jgi:YHS domain-containing protein